PGVSRNGAVRERNPEGAEGDRSEVPHHVAPDLASLEPKKIDAVPRNVLDHVVQDPATEGIGGHGSWRSSGRRDVEVVDVAVEYIDQNGEGSYPANGSGDPSSDAS